LTDDTWVSITGELAGDASERIYSFGSNDAIAGIALDGTGYVGTDNVVIDGEYSVYFRRGDSPPVRLGRGLAVGLTPDGKSALTTNVSGAERGLSLLPVGAGQPRVLDLRGVSYRGLAGQYVRFSSDGRRFAFVGGTEGEGRAAWVLDLEAGVPRKVSFDGATGAVISPDGSKVAVSDPLRGMYVASSAGNVPVPGAPKDEIPVAWMADSASVLSWDKTLPPTAASTSSDAAGCVAPSS
jgi:hypothetical protein